MQTLHGFENVSTQSKPVALTIGTFDGVHLGHQAVLQALKATALAEGGECAVVSFTNHPSDILRPAHRTKSLCTVTQKIELIKQQKIDYLFLLEFSKELANMTAGEFISRIRPLYPFSHLILGHDASFGKDRAGNQEAVKLLAKEHNFEVHYLPQTKCDGLVVSSSRIRTFLEDGNLEMVDKFLGRKYSIMSTVIPGRQRGRSIGFPTANLNVSGLCLPPLGVYAVNVAYRGEKLPGVANLGIAPTVKDMSDPQLEVHIFDFKGDLYNHEIDVEFIKFIRSERKFNSVEELHDQIQKDIHETKLLRK